MVRAEPPDGAHLRPPVGVSLDVHEHVVHLTGVGSEPPPVREGVRRAHGGSLTGMTVDVDSLLASARSWIDEDPDPDTASELESLLKAGWTSPTRTRTRSPI